MSIARPPGVRSSDRQIQAPAAIETVRVEASGLSGARGLQVSDLFQLRGHLRARDSHGRVAFRSVSRVEPGIVHPTAEGPYGLAPSTAECAAGGPPSVSFQVLITPVPGDEDDGASAAKGIRIVVVGIDWS